MKKFLFSVLVLSLSAFSFNQASAEEIGNFSVRLVDNEYVSFQWDALADSILQETDGYAVQWNEYESKIKNDRLAEQYLEPGENALSVRAGTFDYRKAYYFRVYTWKKIDERTRIMTNGSKVKKCTFFPDGTMETEELTAVNDVTVATTTTSDEDTSDTTIDASLSLTDFGVFQSRVFDDYAVINWSHTSLFKDDYDGFWVELSKTSDFAEIVKLVKLPHDVYSLKYDGLAPETTYYARGYFYKSVGGEDQKFGVTHIKTLTTLPVFTAEDIAKMNRLRSRGLLNDFADKTVFLDGQVTEKIESASAEDEEVDDEALVSDSSESSTTSSEVTTETTTNTSSSGMTTAEIRREIARLEKKLSELRVQLKVASGETTSTETETASTGSIGHLSLRERIMIKMGLK